MVSALDFQAEYCGFESRLGQNNFQTISTPTSYLTCPGLSIKWTGRCLVTAAPSVHGCSMKARLYKYMYITIPIACMCLGCLVALKIHTTSTTKQEGCASNGFVLLDPLH